ncbi:MAG: DUF5947 family protein [Actinocatenispora sp.]
MTAGLRRFRTPADRPPVGEHCDMCAEPIGSEHSHVVDTQSRALECTCRGCYLLFTQPGAAGGRHRAVPDRYRHSPSFASGAALFDAIGIPVRMAFFLTSSAVERTVAFYPSPAGATESQLSTEAWRTALADNPAFGDIAVDTEALLVNRAPGGFECFLVPIDACYRLVGLVRLHWKGFDGGSEAWRAIDGYFDELRNRSERVGGEDHG